MPYEKEVENILGAKSKVRILKFLINNKGSYSANQISKKIGMTPRTILLALENLKKSQVIKYELKKKDKIYSINEENWYVENILKNIFYKKDKFLADLKKYIKDRLSPYLGDISSILLGKGKILIIFKEYVVSMRMEEVKRYVESELKDYLRKKFSKDYEFEYYYIFSIITELSDNKYESIYGLTSGQVGTSSSVKKERLEKAKDFFEF